MSKFVTVDKVNVDEQTKDDSISKYESVTSGHEEIEQDEEGMQIIYHYLILYYKLLHLFD